MEFRIWSFEHNAWWRTNWSGYTENMDEAGLYSLRSALKICEGANQHVRFPNEAMVPVKNK